jgi:hypothetical protein
MFPRATIKNNIKKIYLTMVSTHMGLIENSIQQNKQLREHHNIFE